MARLKRFDVWHLVVCGLAAWLAIVAFGPAPRVAAHIVPAEKLHPVVESYRRMTFLLNLNPVLWDEVRKDSDRIGRYLTAQSAAEGADVCGA